MWVLFKKQSVFNKPVFSENNQDLFIKACMNFIMNDIRSIDDEDKYVSPCYYAKYWNKLHNTIISMMISDYSFNDFIELEANYSIETAQTIDLPNGNDILSKYIPHPDVGNDYHQGFMYRKFSMLEINNLRTLTDDTTFPSDIYLDGLSESDLYKHYISLHNYVNHVKHWCPSDIELSYDEWLLKHNDELTDDQKNSLRTYTLNQQRQLHIMWHLAFSYNPDMVKKLNLELLPDPQDCQLIPCKHKSDPIPTPRVRCNSV